MASSKRSTKKRSTKPAARRAAGPPAPGSARLRDAVAEARDVRRAQAAAQEDDEGERSGGGYVLEAGEDPDDLYNEGGEDLDDGEEDDDGEDAVDGVEDWDEEEEDEEEEDDEGDDDEAVGEETDYASRPSRVRSPVVPEYASAEEYLAGHVIPLPSGKSIRVRPVSLISMIERDETEVILARREGRDAKTVMPNHLLAAARRMVYGETKAKPANRLEERRAAYQQGKRQAERTASGAKANETRESAQLIDFLCTRLIASFKVSMKPQRLCPPGVLSVGSIFEADKIAVVNYAMEGQRALASFRR
jgi:hypothetical protein